VNDHGDARPTASRRLPDADALLLQQLRSGDAQAFHRFVREEYGAVHRYLLYLTGRPDLAEDLTRETLLEGWRCLDSFEGRGSLRSWLHRIAHRQFLRMLRRRPAELAREGLADAAAPHASAWLESVELRVVVDRLPIRQREVMLLHYLEGYTSGEIAAIVGAPASTVRRRLPQACERLRQELGEDDLSYLNAPLAPGLRIGGESRPVWLPLDQTYTLEARLTRGEASPEATMEESTERREFLRQAAAGAASLMLPEAGKEVVDSRLVQKTTLAFKGTALADLCGQLRSTTGVHLTAGPSVADEKVTLFCEKLPLREVMRQLSRPFGYTWLRSRPEGGDWRYELVQDLRSQFLEEELRNRDRHEALLALEREMDRYRAYLDLSPDEAFQRARTAAPAEKPLLWRNWPNTAGVRSRCTSASPRSSWPPSRGDRSSRSTPPPCPASSHCRPTWPAECCRASATGALSTSMMR
jgi:RNA polymerase sigma-70 factor (ECF subfamily)